MQSTTLILLMGFLSIAAFYLGRILDGLTRENFRIAHDISAYSFPAMAKAALPYLNNEAPHC